MSPARSQPDAVQAGASWPRWRRRLLVAGYPVAGVLFVLVGGIDLVQLQTGIGLPSRTASDMLVVAHRGDVEQYPEDTLEAIRSAADLGVDGIEFDVHQSADGTWWVVHDPTLDRTTTGSGAVFQLPDGVISAATIDAGLGYDAGRHRDIGVPRLDEVLRALDGFRGALYLDLQHAIDADAASLASLLRGRPATIMVRSLADARAATESNPDISTLIRFEDTPPDPVLDGWLAEAFTEVTVGRTSASQLPLTTYVDESLYSSDEGPAIRRAWALNVVAFLTKHPRIALNEVAGLRTAAGD